jgi:hypothetical protein
LWVRAEIVPRNTGEALFRSQGMKNPNPRIRMFDGLNERWIDFVAPAAHTIKGSVDVDDLIEALTVTGSAP